MATVAQAIARQPQHFQDRMPPGTWLRWVNSLLEELASLSVLPPNSVERGAIPANGKWITRPNGLRSISSIYLAANENMKFNWREAEGYIKLDGGEVEESDDSTLTANTLTLPTTTSLTVNIDDLEADQLEDYLMVVTTGTRAGETFRIGGNDVSAAGVTKVEFELPLTAAFTAPEVTAVAFYDPLYYVVMRYTSSFTDLTATSTEIPIPDQYERRIVNAWLEYMCEKEAQAASAELQIAEQAYRRLVVAMVSEIRGVPKGPIRGRAMPKIRQL